MRSSSLALVVPAVALSLVGCRIQKPGTPVPAPPTIDRFTVSQSEVVRGTEVTLSWETTEATSISLRDGQGAELGVSIDTLDGTSKVTIADNALFVLVANGPGGSDARAVSVSVQGTAQRVSFQAIPPVVLGGQSATLVWNAPGAREVRITAGAAEVELGGQVGSGAVVVRPTQDTQYTLTADDKTASATVTVQPQVLSLEAPNAVEVGAQVSLAWTSAGAQKIVISSEGRGQLAEITDPAQVASGTFSETVPPRPNGGLVQYRVTAVKNTEQHALSADVVVGSSVQIVRLDAPTTAAANQPYTLAWETVGARSIEVLVDGTTILESRQGRGETTFVAAADDFSVEFVARGVTANEVRRTISVDIVGAPSTVTLSAAPTSVSFGAPVTLTWAAMDARRVRIFDDRGFAVFSTVGVSAEGGSYRVYPSTSTRYRVVVDNGLGSTPVSAEASVTVTGAVPSLTQVPPTAISGQAVTLQASDPRAVLTGFAHSEVLVASQADFIDISRTGQRIITSQSVDGVVQINPGFTFNFFGKPTGGNLVVSRSGWMAFGALLEVRDSFSTLPVSTLPGVIAPYWRSLVVPTDGNVLYELRGEAPEQELIVQWHRLQLSSVSDSVLTFQVRVKQDGRISFHYQTMVTDDSTSFALGIQDKEHLHAVVSTQPPASNTARYFFSPSAGSVTVRAFGAATFAGQVASGGAAYRVEQRASAITVPADLTPTEIMYRTASLTTAGQYLELFNRTDRPLDLTGWRLVGGPDAGFVFPSGFTIPSRQVVLVGSSTNPADNDDAGVSTSWGTFSLFIDGGALAFEVGDAGATLTYGRPLDGGFGASVEFDSELLVGPTGSPGIVACEPRGTFGSLLQRGSPGTVPGCRFFYDSSSIPSRFVDLADAGGMRLFDGGVNLDAIAAAIDFADAGGPIPLIFGVPQPVLSAAGNGYLIPGRTTSGTDFNRVVGGGPGVIAPFWDDLDDVNLPGRPSQIFYKHFAMGEDALTPAPHWVVQWSHLSPYLDPDSDLNFEVFLFDDGAVEYHYGQMIIADDYDPYGASATTFLEHHDAGYAHVINMNNSNDGRIRPFTGYRFTPRP